MSGAHLAIRELSAGYQPGIDVVREVTLDLPPGRVTAVVGPNGAGKSTLLKTVFGFLRPRAGQVTLDGRPIHSLGPHRIKGLGVGYVPQGLNLFPQLTVEENLRMGGWTLRRDGRRLRARLDQVYDLFPALRQHRRRPAHELSGGQARMLATAREVVPEPRLLLVDEPTAGLSPALSGQVYEFLATVRRALGTSLLLVDQQIQEALEIADHVVLMDLGRVRAQGPRAEMHLARVRALIQRCLEGVDG
ncbi:MAG TPA: ABC transporter ATP-binding protein [Candidatus Dormibacteraeota bacterium]|nr:ABC transporter ATP-binding protein [Candidatus Dormibacteraeota bacterium]